jgi:prepilin-type N-terminal cleavage/methylation domain-containing protein
MATPRPARRAGFSLLEVILSLAVLGGAIAILGEAARLALKNAEFTRDMAQAQLLCEGKLSEIVAGIVPAQPIARATFGTATGSGEPVWLYSIETASVEEEGLLAVRVTVSRDLPEEKRPVRFSLVRWIPESSATESEESDQGTMQGSSSSGSSSGGGTQ